MILDTFWNRHILWREHAGYYTGDKGGDGSEQTAEQIYAQ